MNNTLALISAFLGGAIVGASVALLTAPEKGEVTRSRIVETLRRRGILAEDIAVEALVAKLADELDD